MAAIDKLYDNNGSVVTRLDAWSNKELQIILEMMKINDIVEQIEMYLDEYTND